MDGASKRAEHLGLVRGSTVALRAAAAAVLLAAVLAAAHALSLDERIRSVLETSRGAGSASLLVHLAAYVGVALVGLPASPLTIVAGATWGTLAGAALGVPGVTLGACAAFLVGRIVARDPGALAMGDGRVARAARAIGRGGVRLVLLLRLAPIVPFSVLNFAFGATPTRLSHFAVGSALGTVPAQLGYACLGAVLASPPGPLRTRIEAALVVGALVLTAAATAGVVALLRRDRAALPGVSPGARS